uniref:Uncharacterized protein n=1 Tax=Rhizophora mucronata TaxID=61149 RepID=A0A2P2NLE8_RHIMU
MERKRKKKTSHVQTLIAGYIFSNNAIN